MVVPKRLGLPLFLGLNVEVGRVPRAVEEAGWANEFRPIVGWTNGWFLIDVNPIMGYALSGPEKYQLDFEPAGKVSVNTQLGFALGVEHYSGLGLLREGLSPLKKAGAPALRHLRSRQTHQRAGRPGCVGAQRRDRPRAHRRDGAEVGRQDDRGAPF